MEWVEWPEGWMSWGNGSMDSHIKGVEGTGNRVECGELMPGLCEEAYGCGYRYYVMLYNLHDTAIKEVLYFKEAKSAGQGVYTSPFLGFRDIFSSYNEEVFRKPKRKEQY